MTPPRNKKRKRYNGPSPLEQAYRNASFDPRPSTGRPDSPHFFFSSSYTVSYGNSINDETAVMSQAEHQMGDNNATKEDDDVKTTAKPSPAIPQVVHQHLNGLCIITAGEIGTWLPTLYPNHDVESIQFVAKEAPACSTAEKRKRQAKMLRGVKVDCAVTPSKVIAKLILKDKHFTDGNIEVNSTDNKDSVEILLCACVWGAIIELNFDLTPKVLMEDPLLDGHLAVIQPSGRFPPSHPTSVQAQVMDDSRLASNGQQSPPPSTHQRH